MECLLLCVWLLFLSVGCQVVNGVNDTVAPQYEIPKGVSVYDIKQVEVYQSDFQNSNLGIYGTDKDVGSCFVSGTGRSSWWKFVLNETLVIQGFLFKGYYDGVVKFRVGKYHDPLGEMKGHMVNPPCQAMNISGEQDYKVFECMLPMEGHVISVEGLTTDYDEACSLKICDVKILI